MKWDNLGFQWIYLSSQTKQGLSQLKKKIKDTKLEDRVNKIWKLKVGGKKQGV